MASSENRRGNGGEKWQARKYGEINKRRQAKRKKEKRGPGHGVRRRAKWPGESARHEKNIESEKSIGHQQQHGDINNGGVTR